MSDIDISQLSETLRLLQDMDYYGVLKIDAAASKEAVRMAYFRESKTFHPDRYFRQISPQDLRIINDIYKLIAEAYRVLSDSQKRRQYDKGLAVDRKNFLRYDPVKIEELSTKDAPRKGWSDAIAKTPMGKKYVREAINLMKTKQFGQADSQVKLALSVEPANEEIKALAEEIRGSKDKAASKNTFTIK